MICDARLDRGFRPSVRVGGANGTFFGDGNHVGKACCVAIHRSRAGKHNVGDVVPGHGAEEADCTVDIRAVVFEGDFRGFPNCL